jgi:hypothetical protein
MHCLLSSLFGALCSKTQDAIDEEDEEALLLAGEDPFDPDLAFALGEELDDEDELGEGDSVEDDDDDDDDMEEDSNSEELDEDPGQRIRAIAAMRRNQGRRR